VLFRSDEISVVGRTDLLDLDFELGGGTFGAMSVPAWSGLTAPLRGAWDRFTGMTGRGSNEGRFKDTVWAKLDSDYRSGAEALETV